MKRLVVMKFGGTSVGDGKGFLRAAGLALYTLKEEAERCVVVVSAMAGMTDLLIGAAQAAARHERRKVEAAAKHLRTRHLAAARALGVAEGALEETIESLVTGFLDLCREIDAQGELCPDVLDTVAATGERLSAPILAATIRKAGKEAEAVDAASLIITDGRFGAASPLMDVTTERCRTVLLSLLKQEKIPVVTGFIGATADGITTTLGRGGSDYTASILGAALEADEIVIWTDVLGVMSADPRLVPEAATIPSLTYAEAVELGHYGAKVIHPKTASPVQEKGIPIRIRSTFNPEGPGTLVCPRKEERAGVRAVAARKGLILVRLRGKGTPGTAARAFAAAAEAETILGTYSTSEQNVCILVDKGDIERVRTALSRAFAAELSRGEVAPIEVCKDLAVVATIGEGIATDPRIAVRALWALEEKGIRIFAVAHGASIHSLPLVVEEQAADEAVRTLHRHFGLGKCLNCDTKYPLPGSSSGVNELEDPVEEAVKAIHSEFDSGRAE